MSVLESVDNPPNEVGLSFVSPYVSSSVVTPAVASVGIQREVDFFLSEVRGGR